MCTWFTCECEYYTILSTSVAISEKHGAISYVKHNIIQFIYLNITSHLLIDQQYVYWF